MHAVYLTGHGGFEKLEYRTDIPVPKAGPGQVLIKVGAAGINNTDINTRIGWYSKKVSGDTNAGGSRGFSSIDNDDASWSGVPLRFPLIQGADCCGRIVSVGEGVSDKRIGQRVLVRTQLRTPVNRRPFECWTFGSECNGGFAQYAVAPSEDTWAVECDWSDIELAAIPCAYSTAEGMLHRAAVGPEDRVLVTGASGGVGSAAVQLAKCRGAHVIALAGKAKMHDVEAMGADQVLERDSDYVSALGKASLTVIVDLVGGKQWPLLLPLLRRGGRYAVAGAIAGPLVELDLRTLYLNDLSFFGCTWQDDIVFENVVRYIEEGRIRPVVSKSYALQDIAAAQQDFIDKKYAGKLVLVPGP